MKILEVSDTDLYGDCQDWLTDTAAKKFIDGEYTHLHFEGWPANELNEAEVIPFAAGGSGVVIGEDISV